MTWLAVREFFGLERQRTLLLRGHFSVTFRAKNRAMLPRQWEFGLCMIERRHNLPTLRRMTGLTGLVCEFLSMRRRMAWFAVVEFFGTKQDRIRRSFFDRFGVTFRAFSRFVFSHQGKFCFGMIE